VRKRKHRYTIPQKMNSNIIEDLAESEGAKSPVDDLRMMIRMVNEFQEDFKETI
jgi:hypothetical protein